MEAGDALPMVGPYFDAQWMNAQKKRLVKSTMYW